MSDSENHFDNDISILLAEKRTSLAVLRTAIAFFTLPLSVFTILTATSRFYDPLESIPLLLIIIIINSILIIFGIYLIVRSFNRIRRIDRRIESIKKNWK